MMSLHHVVLNSMDEPHHHSSLSNLVTGNNGSSGSSVEASRQRTMQTLEYYGNVPTRMAAPELYKHGTSNRANGMMTNSPRPPSYRFGLPDMRASYNERYSPRSTQARLLAQQHRSEKSPQRSQSERTNRWVWEDGPPASPRTGLYRSNSSLDLEELLDDRTIGLRREYGSASSIDVISTNGESFFAMLRDFHTDNPDQRSPGPAKIADYLRGRIDCAPTTQNASNSLVNGSGDSLDDASSPKVKSKFQKLWESKDKNKSKGKSSSSSEPFLFRKLRGTKSDAVAAETASKGSDNSLDADNRLEDRIRRKAFAHYDVQSVTANLSYAARLRSVLSRRRNTTTGASAASMLNRNNATPNDSTENLGPEDSDSGDCSQNDLILSCPFFRNEIGGEEERVISLTRVTSKRPRLTMDEMAKGCSPPLHKPSVVCGLSVLEKANELHWKNWSCPYQQQSLQIENLDHGVTYYKQYFYGREHQNWFGVDENLGPVAVSICREKTEDGNSAGKDSGSQNSSQYQYRLIIRTSELTTLRGTVLEDAIPSLAKHSSSRSIPAKEVMEYVAPELQLSSLRLGTAIPQVEEQLVKLDQQGMTNHYKVGIMYCKEGQATEEEMYNNEAAGPAFDEFLEMLGQRVRLKGFDKYRAQLDNKTDSTGLYSVYSTFQNCEVMFHVSTMLPFTQNNRQQLLRKRHIGNDIVTIVFQEPDALSFTPKNIRSHFQHVFIVVRAINPCTDNTRYAVAVSRSKEVPVFGPPIPEGGTFPKSKSFADFLLAKVINAENAAHRSEKFATMASRTRQEYLKDLATNYITTTTIDAGVKFSMLSFGGRRKERTRPRFFPDSCIKGAIVWNVQVDDYGQATLCECFLGISADSLVLIEESSRELVFACPTNFILGWSSQTSSLKIYYHQGECIVLRTRDPDIDEIQEIVSRLSCVTQGCETQEFTLRRNSVGQLGFHVQHDGTITEVESYGFAWQAGLRQGSRLVEICKVVVSAMTHDQMVDLLKTSMTVTVTVIPPHQNGSPRRGCSLHNCSYLSSSLPTGDYENIAGLELADTTPKSLSLNRQQPVPQSQNKLGGRVDPTSSPPRSTSSGYSGSSRSVATNLDQRFNFVREVNSSSSQSSEEKWYDVTEIGDPDIRKRNKNISANHNNNNNHGHKPKDSPPPPLPARLIPASHSSAFSQVVPKRRDALQSSFHSKPPISRNQDHSHNIANTNNGYSNVHNHNHVHSHGQALPRGYADHNTPQPDSISSISSGRHRNSPVSENSALAQHDRLHPLHSSAQNLAPTRDAEKTKLSVLASPAIVISDGQSDSSSERLLGTRSEDEQSGSSNSLSPRSRRRWQVDGWGTGSSSSSRNQSPRLAGRIGMETAGEAKLRLGITNRHVNRNSGHSTFQEDLLKLINPDLINPQTGENKICIDESMIGLPRTPPLPPSKNSSLKRGISPEILSHSICSAPSQATVSNAEGDVIFTTARPATVISNTSSSPAPSENRLSKEDRLSPRVTNNSGVPKLKPLPPTPRSIMPLPDERKEIDWSSLVDTATKAMQVVGVPSVVSKPSTCTSNGTWVDDVVEQLEVDTLQGSSIPVAVSGSSGRRVRELEARVKQLEQHAARDAHRKAILEAENRSLREENLRLQEESQTAAAQLRRFTEWFFQTIDRQ